MYTVRDFKDTISVHTTWPEMKNYIQTSGLLVQDESSQLGRCIIRYDNKRAPEQGTRWFRSVVWDTYNNMPLCVAPPRVTEAPLCDRGLLTNEVRVEEFVEGVMINAYKIRGESNTAVHIATRSVLGAKAGFYSDRSFEDMLSETLQFLGLDLYTCVDDPDNSTRSTFASFVLQHPGHKMVTKFDRPALYRVHVGCVNEDGSVRIVEGTRSWLYNNDTLAIREYCPPMIRRDANTDITNWFNDICQQRPETWQGVVIKDGFGQRWKMVNPKHEYLHDLRGNESDIKSRFLRHLRDGRIGEYLNKFPEDLYGYNNSSTRLSSTINKLYRCYVDTHMSHERHTSELRANWKYHVALLHERYIRRRVANNTTPIHLRDVEEHLKNALPLYVMKLMGDESPWAGVGVIAGRDT